MFQRKIKRKPLYRI